MQIEIKVEKKYNNDFFLSGASQTYTKNAFHIIIPSIINLIEYFCCYYSYNFFLEQNKKLRKFETRKKFYFGVGLGIRKNEKKYMKNK